MTGKKTNTEGWVYVVVCDPEKEASFLGLHNSEKNIDFIPAFTTKVAAEESFLSLPREKGRKYEIQAVHIEDLHTEAQKNGFVVALTEGEETGEGKK